MLWFQILVSLSISKRSYSRVFREKRLRLNMSSNVSEQSKEENTGGKRIKNISKRRKFRSFSLGKRIFIRACLIYILNYLD